MWSLIRKTATAVVLATSSLSKITDTVAVPRLTTLEGIMAALRAVLFVTAVFLCGVNGQFSVTIPCTSSGKRH